MFLKIWGTCLPKVNGLKNRITFANLKILNYMAYFN